MSLSREPSNPNWIRYDGFRSCSHSIRQWTAKQALAKSCNAFVPRGTGLRCPLYGASQTIRFDLCMELAGVWMIWFVIGRISFPFRYRSALFAAMLPSKPRKRLLQKELTTRQFGGLHRPLLHACFSISLRAEVMPGSPPAQPSWG